MAMKTTIALDDDVAVLVSERCRLSGKTADRVVNEMLRENMEVSANGDKPNWVTPHHSGYVPGFDPLKMKQFLEDEDIEHYLRVSRQ